MNINNYSIHFLYYLFFLLSSSSCDAQSNNNPSSKISSAPGKTESKAAQNFKEGSDYLIFERVRMMDNVSFTRPVEAFSVLLPKGWQHENEVIWNLPGAACAGTYQRLSAQSADKTYMLQIFPDAAFNWTTNQQLLEFYRNNGSASSTCATLEPMDAEQYIRNIFITEIGNPAVLDIKPNQIVAQELRQINEKAAREMGMYSHGQMQFYPSAVVAEVRWQDGTKGYIIVGATVAELLVPNNYTGTYVKNYTTIVTKRTVFKYSSSNNEEAQKLLSVIMSSFRSNPTWSNTINNFWKEVRQKKQIDHVGRLEVLDGQTRQKGADAIRKGEERLNEMDTQMRSWERQQNSQDRMHTEFIKTIRGVENFRDATGKYEMTAGYEHVWSRSDGSSFVMSNNSNLDPAFLFKDQSWKQMKKVD
jgi:hypothetical protein